MGDGLDGKVRRRGVNLDNETLRIYDMVDTIAGTFDSLLAFLCRRVFSLLDCCRFEAQQGASDNHRIWGHHPHFILNILVPPTATGAETILPAIGR